MNEAILDKKIKTWEDQLLDLGKRNKMISFRESKRATLKILKPSFEELYQQIVVDEKELTFQKAIDRDSDVRVYSILSLLDKLSCPMEVNIGDIRAEGSLPEVKKTLKHLRLKILSLWWRCIAQARCNLLIRLFVENTGKRKLLIFIQG